MTKINASFQVVEVRSQNVLEQHRYMSVTDRKKEKIKTRMEKGEVVLYCCCANRIEQRITSNLKIYNAQNFAEHSPNCCKNKRLDRVSEYEQGWKQNGERLEAKLANQLSIDEKGTPADIHRISIVSGKSKQDHEVTLFGLATKINLMTWERFILREERVPADKWEFGKKLFGTLQMIDFSGVNRKKESLQSVLYARTKVGNMKPLEDRVFVYFFVDSIDIQVYDGKKVTFINCKDSFQNNHRFYIDGKQLAELLKEDYSQSSRFLIAGFAYRKTNKTSILTIDSFCLLPISERGLFVENEYERQVFDSLCDRDRVFYKPYLNMPEYNGKRPSFILTDRSKMCLGEVFLQNSEERKSKLKTAFENSEEYSIWRWDIFKGEPLKLPR